ncbi:30S ribosomal protein S2 [compost metagenome]
MMTNFETIKSSIARLRKIDAMKEKGEFNYLTKKERAKLEKEYLRLSDFLNGIREMKESPAAMFVVDLPKEHIAVAEAKRLGIPVVGIADTNSDPEAIEFPIPGNDDAIRSIKLFANLVAEAYLEGAQVWEQKIRTMTDKQSDVAREAKGEEEAPKRRTAKPGAKEAPKKAAGPAVVKATKARKLVAAGTAEEVEIQAELENNEKTDDSAE